MVYVGTEEDFKRLYAWFIETVLQKVSNWQLGSSNDEEYEQRVKTKQIILQKLDTYQKDFIEEFNITPNALNNARRSARRRRPNPRYQQ